VHGAAVLLELGGVLLGLGILGRLAGRLGLSAIPLYLFSIVIAGLAVAAGREPQLGPLAAAYVLLLAVGGPVLARVADPLVALARRRSRRAAGEQAAVPAGRTPLSRTRR